LANISPCNILILANITPQYWANTGIPDWPNILCCLGLLFWFLLFFRTLYLYALLTVWCLILVYVYFQGNRKCSFLPGCACLYLYSPILCSYYSKLNDDDDDDNYVRYTWTIRYNVCHICCQILRFCEILCILWGKLGGQVGPTFLTPTFSISSLFPLNYTLYRTQIPP